MDNNRTYFTGNMSLATKLRAAGFTPSKITPNPYVIERNYKLWHYEITPELAEAVRQYYENEGKADRFPSILAAALKGDTI